MNSAQNIYKNLQDSHASQPIAIIAAFEKEVRRIKNCLNGIEEGNLGDIRYYFGTFKSKRVVIALSGAGISKAKSAGQKIADKFSPWIIISTGSCGALKEGIRKRDVILGSEIIHKRGGISENKNENSTEIFCPEIQAGNRVWHILKASSFTAFQGRILSLGRFIYQRETKEILQKRYDAIAVEMESGGIAQVAKEKGLPFISVKVVSDDLRGNLVDYNKLVDRDGRLILKKALPYFFKRPRELFWALRFYFDLQRTYNKLYKVHEKILEVI